TTWPRDWSSDVCSSDLDNFDPFKELIHKWPADAALLAWFRDGHAALVGTLESAPPDLKCFTFLPAPSALAFWARRQAHETGIHQIGRASCRERGRVAAV